MSFGQSQRERGFRLRFSSRGMGAIGGGVLILTAFLLFLSGLLRGELASLLWGGTLLFLILFCLTAVLISGILNLRLQKAEEHPQPPVFHHESITAGHTITEERKLPLPLHSFPGSRAVYQVRYRFGKRRFLAEAGIGAGREDFLISGVPYKRGRFSGQAFILFRDLPGIFQVELSLPVEGLFHVLPREKTPRPGRLLPSLGGEATPEVKRKRESSELFDMRKFYPGDDPRKLHWKLYAHSGELFLRKGEPEPPPSGRYQIILDLNLMRLFSVYKPLPYRIAGRRKLTESVLEFCLSAAAGCLTDLLRRGSEVILILPGHLRQSFYPGDEEALLSSLAVLPYNGDPGGNRSGGGNEGSTFSGIATGTGVYLFSTPFSREREDILNSLKQSAGTLRTGLILPPPPSDGERHKRDFRSLFLLSKKTGGSKYSTDTPFPPLPPALISVWEEELRNLKSDEGGNLYVL